MLLCGCAGTPDVTLTYYPAKATVTVTVNQTVECSADQTSLISTYATTLSTAYTADYSKGHYALAIKKIDGSFADSDITMNWFDDGRLKSINQTTTGQGEAIVKAAISVGVAAALGGSESTGKPVVEMKPLAECEVIKARGNGKPVTLIFTKVFDPQTSGPLPLTDKEVNDRGLYDKLSANGKLPAVGIAVYPAVKVLERALFTPASPDDVTLTLTKMKSVQIDFTVSGAAIATSYVTVPGTETYPLPIPKAALFGKQNFALTLSEAGAVLSVEYGKSSGTASVLNAATAAATAAAPESASSQLAQTKAEADLIVQQQRLTKCLADPANCQ